MSVGYMGKCRGDDERCAFIERYVAEHGEPLAVIPWVESNAFDDVAKADLSRQFEDLQVAFINVPPAYTYQVGRLALRRGVHVFLEWAAMPSLAECEDLAQLAEEAGVEVGVSRPLRFHPLFDGWPEDWHASQIAVRHTMQLADSGRFQRSVEDAVDLCRCLAGASNVRKVEAQIVRSSPARPEALLAGLRFQNGAYAHMQIRRHAPLIEHTVHAAGPGFQVDVNLRDHIGYLPSSDFDENASSDVAFEKRFWLSSGHRDLLDKETRAFLQALGDNAPAPVSLMDGYRTLQLVEAIRKNLR